MEPEPDSRWSSVMTRRQGLRDPVTRSTLSIALIVTPVIFGALALTALGPDASTLGWVLCAVAVPGAAGGWLHAPARALRVRGAFAGVVIAMGSLAAAYASLLWRGADDDVRFGVEFVVPIVIGGLPGAALYYALVRGHTSERGDRP